MASTSAIPLDDSPKIELSRDFIREGDNVLIRLPSTIMKAIKITLNSTVSLGKYGAFKSNLLIGKPYGITYEIIESALVPIQIKVVEIEETEANNENILSIPASVMASSQIEELKKSGLSGREIIAQQVLEHSAFEMKTNYSKDKYLKRKEAKFLQSFTTIEPTSHNIAHYHFNKVPEVIRDLRPDVLSQLLSYANVRPNGKLIMVEDTHGLITAACVERMGGEGEILLITDSDSPPAQHLLDSFNFTAKQLSVITYIHWAATSSSYTPPDLPLEIAEDDSKAKSSREQLKYSRRRQESIRMEAARSSFMAGNFDSLILATPYDPTTILPILQNHLAGSASVVIQSTSLALLFKTSQFLKNSTDFLSPNLIEPWLRQYQVLPGRTHPEMSGMGHGGYLLSCIRVLDDLEAVSVTASSRRGPGFGKGKKRKAEEEVKKAVEGKVAKLEEGIELREGDGEVVANATEAVEVVEKLVQMEE